MGQLTLARFRGDTTFGLVARIISTFTGGLIGTVMWYVAGLNDLSVFFIGAQVCFYREWQRQPLWTGSCMCGLLPVIFLCTIVLAYPAHDEYDYMGYSRIGIIWMLTSPSERN
jgi:hypothetical protein